MKRYWIAIPLKRTTVESSGAEPAQVEEWLEQKLSHLTSLFEGNGRVHVKQVDDLRLDVELNFVVDAESPLDVQDRFHKDIETVGVLASGIAIHEAASFKLCIPTVEGESLGPIFIRVDPKTGKYRDTED